jgi:hypothetical protein
VSWARPKPISSLFPYPQEHLSSPSLMPLPQEYSSSHLQQVARCITSRKPHPSALYLETSTMSFIPSMSVSIHQPFVHSTSRRCSRSNLSMGYGHVATSSGFMIPRPHMLRSSLPLCKRCASTTCGSLFFLGISSSITDFIPASSRRPIPSSRSPASLSSSGLQVFSSLCYQLY